MPPEPSLILLLGILQRHGLTLDVLQIWAHHCEGQHTGELTLFTTEGRITSYKAVSCGKVHATKESLLTRV